MTIFCDPDVTTDYVLKRQREAPDTERVIWKLRPLVGRKALRILAMPDAERAGALLDAGIASWATAAGKSEPTPKGHGPADCLAPADAMEIALVILQSAGLTEADRGNSESPPTA